MNTLEIANGIYYVGVNDRTLGKFEGLWSLPYGVSYNSYIVKGENSEDGVRFIIYRKTKKQKKKKENNWVKNKGEKA